MSWAGYADHGCWRWRALVLSRGSVLSPSVLKYHWLQCDFTACKWVLLKVSDFRRLYYYEARTSNTVELPVQAISEKWFAFESILLYILVFLNRLQDHWRRQKSQQTQMCSLTQTSVRCLPSGLTWSCCLKSRVVQPHHRRRTWSWRPHRLSPSVHSTGYDSWGKVFGDPRHPQIISQCCGGAVGEWLVWKSGWWHLSVSVNLPSFTSSFYHTLEASSWALS